MLQTDTPRESSDATVIVSSEMFARVLFSPTFADGKSLTFTDVGKSCPSVF